MPWECKTVEKLREEFVQAAANGEKISKLCREFGISRPTAYKWMKRAQAGESMSDQSRRPKQIANRVAAHVEEKVLEMRTANPGWGGKTIHAVLQREGYPDLPCAKTCDNILKRNGRIDPEESAKHKAYLRFQKEQCNQMWQTDFKGDFPLKGNNRCHILNILDDHSRFCIKSLPFTSTRGVVIPAFEAAFREFGMPDSVLSDNGCQFAGFRHGYTQFERWLMDLDILPIHSRIKHPQTQGKIERFHRTLEQELLRHFSFDKVEDVDARLQPWREKYNYIRPHTALHMQCPGDVYVPSLRTYPTVIQPVQYGGRYHVVKVNSWGYVRFANFQIYLSETMRGALIEFRPSDHDEVFLACYRNFVIAKFSAISGELISRSIFRLTNV